MDSRTFLNRRELLAGVAMTAGSVGSAMAGEDSYDVVVYGATPAGVCAAVAARREGASVALVEQSGRVGGIYTAGGLGLTDSFFMDLRMLDGLYEEVHARIDDYYKERGIQYRVPGFRDRLPKQPQGRWLHEPKVAELILNQILQKNGVVVLLRHRLSGAGKTGTAIRSVRFENGKVLRAKQFIDATYTGDLMAAARVQYTVGREARSTYGESLAGKQFLGGMLGQRKHIWKVNPRASDGKLLPFVNIEETELGPEAEGDHKISNYNFRVNITNDEKNLVAFAEPPNYDPGRYELLRRYFKVYSDQETERLVARYPLPNRKFDCNDLQDIAFPLGLPGGSWAYPDADYATREKIDQSHRHYLLGYFWFLLTDPSTPAKFRDSLKGFGLPKDEHVNSGHFPELLYIREARRMTGEYVLTQSDIEKQDTKPDSVGIGLGPITIHNVQRVASADGYYHEGAAHTTYNPFAKPYQIPYRSMLPRPDQCSNLLVPVCLSASHVAFNSIRLEPTWMMPGQSAGVAAAMAAKSGNAVSEVEYPLLRRRLLEQKQVLDLVT
ncbi:MAG: FAD-dependent oxidoreductase [Acidobacteria bacterium]|nr:FAD-dependent oxidoreductase [Acidobacteriota bacterium]